MLHTGTELLTGRQTDRLTALFVDPRPTTPTRRGRDRGDLKNLPAHDRRLRDPDRGAGKKQMQQHVNSLRAGAPKALTGLITLGRTLKKRAVDVLAHFDRHGTSSGPTEAINGRREQLRGSALGFRHLTNYTARRLPETAEFRT